VHLLLVIIEWLWKEGTQEGLTDSHGTYFYVVDRSMVNQIG